MVGLLLAHIQPSWWKVSLLVLFLKYTFIYALPWCDTCFMSNFILVCTMFICVITNLLQNEIPVVTCVVSFFNLFMLWIINDNHYLHFNFIHSTVIGHTIQQWKFVYDKDMYAHNCVHIVLFSLFNAHNLAFMLFILPTLLITKPSNCYSYTKIQRL